MIVLRLYGGLGNQLFQLGAALLLAKRSKIDRLVVDLSQIENYATSHNFVLDRILNYELIFDKMQIKLEFREVALTKFRIPKWINFVSKINPFISDSNFSGLIKQYYFLKNYLLDGYFQECICQSEFNEIVVILGSLISSDFLNVPDEDYRYDAVAHIRGGDFLTLNRNPTLNSEFYKSAFNSLHINGSRQRILVVTDDVRYAHEILEEDFGGIEFIVKAGDEIEDFLSIYQISNRILAPSTFGLMASALGRNQADSRVFAWPFWYGNIERSIRIPNEAKFESGSIK